jgi:shikimate kinase
MTIFLTGFMGTGKTTVGTKLAERLGLPFFDTDREIERAEGRPISAIFASDGEAYFRILERRVIEAAPANAVVATGGGAVVDPVNRNTMRAAGPIICLSADPDTIQERTAVNDDRPLLGQQDRASRIRALLAQRAPAYAESDVVIDTSELDIGAVVDQIMKFLEDRQATEEGA